MKPLALPNLVGRLYTPEKRWVHISAWTQIQIRLFERCNVDRVVSAQVYPSRWTIWLTIERFRPEMKDKSHFFRPFREPLTLL